MRTWRWLRPRLRPALPPPSDLAEIARHLAERLPIYDAKEREPGTVVIHGRDFTHDFRVVFNLGDPSGARKPETLVEVRPHHPELPSGFALFPRTSVSQADVAESVATGDRLFDRRWVLEGDRLSILAALSRQDRMMIGRSGYLSVSNGWLYMLVEGLNTETEALEAQISHASSLALRLAERLMPEVTGERLLESLSAEMNGQVRLKLTEGIVAQHEGASAVDGMLDFWNREFEVEKRTQVRMRVLRLMVENLPDRQGTAALLEKGLLDPSPDVRLFAARHAGAAGLEVMKRVAQTRFASEDTRIDALFLLGQRTDETTFREALLVAAKEAAPRVRRYALQRLLDEPGPQLSEDLLRVAKGSDREAAEELASSLAQAPGSVSEPALLQLLSSRSTRVKRAAALSLGQVGSVDAVPKLLELALPIIFDGSLRDVARASIDQIQRRIQNGATGGLSLIESGEQAGALSAPETEAGALSFRCAVPTDLAAGE